MIYLASPFFNDREIENYNKVIKKLRDNGVDVFVPREHAIPQGNEMPNAQWGNEVFYTDIRALTSADMLLCIYDGMYSDSGTAWELGFAEGLTYAATNTGDGEGMCTCVIIPDDVKIVSLMAVQWANYVVRLSDFLKMSIDELNEKIENYVNIDEIRSELEQK